MVITNQIKRSLEEWSSFCKDVAESTNVKFNETLLEQQQRKELALKDYNYFFKTYLKMYCDDGQTDCAYFHIDAANAIKKDPNIFAALEWPREHAKTVHATIGIPLWLFIHNEVTGMILMSRSYDMAANALGDIQAQFQKNDLFKHDWGEHFQFGDWSDGDFTTTGGIRFLALGRGQAPQGARKGAKRPNLAICSDLDDYEIVQNEKRVLEVVDVITGALLPALAIKGGRMIVENNRIHPRSIMAHMVGDITHDTPKREGIYHSKVFATEKKKGVRAYISEGGTPAWKERYTTDELARRFKQVGIVKTKGEYYHEHTIEGKIFKERYFQWGQIPPLNTLNIIIGYFDPSFVNSATSDYKAIAVWGLKDYKKYCIKRFTRRSELSAAYEFMSRMDDSLPLGVGIIWYIEKQFITEQIRIALNKHNLKRKAENKKALVLITDTRVKENKFTRIIKMEPDYSNGDVVYNQTERHDTDMIEGNNQVKGIEPGYKSPDDAPDADEGAWHYLNMHIPNKNFTPIIGPRRSKSHT